MRSLSYLVAVCLVFGVGSMATGQVFSEDFEAYAAGSEIHGQGGWKGWDNTASAGAPTSGVYFYSGAISVEIGGATDLVHEFDITGGRWVMKVMQYIPSGTTGENFFILLNTYNDGGAGNDWSVQWNMNLATGTINLELGSGSAKIVYDQWVELKFIIDLDGNTIEEYYNGELLSTSVWDNDNHDTIGAIDLYGNSASPVYYDDITIEEYVIYNAQAPNPADGEEGVVNALLRWTAGDTAALHDVYLGTSAELTEADLVAPQQQFTMYFHMDGLEPGTTYYWRVDEVEADTTTTHQGDVWSFTTAPLIAHSPDPGDGFKWVLADVTLTWQAGQGAASHKLYFGADADAVAARDPNVSMGELLALSAETGSLEQGATYYWVVDEIDNGGVKHEGEVWKFTTLSEIPITDPDLVGWWMLDEGQGATAVDSSGYDHHGSVQGMPEWVLDGYHGGALMLDGVDDYVEIPHSEALTVDDEVTVMAWVNAKAYTGANGQAYQGIIAKSNGPRSYSLYLQGAGTLHFSTGGAGSSSSGTVPLNEWVHVAAQVVGGQHQYYINGTSAGSGGSDITLPGTADTAAVLIGNTHEASREFGGMMDDARIYSKALTIEEIEQAMRGNPLLAGDPEPGQASTVDVRDIAVLRWSAGQTAASHDVYFGTTWGSVSGADRDAPEFQGNQPGTSFPVAGLVEFGGGEYYWRIDEVEAGGMVQAGYVWKFTVPDYLIVDDFESYTNEVGERVFEAWIDGVGFTLPEPGSSGNGTGAAVGHDVWDASSPYYKGSIMETRLVVDGVQSLPLYYDNAAAPYLSEAERTWAVSQDWTSNGVDTLVLYVRGIPTNVAEPVYVVVADNLGRTAVVTQADPEAALATQWIEWQIPLSDLADAGVNPAAVKKMTLGLGNQAAPTPGGAGVLYIDEIRVITLASGEDAGQ